MRRRQDAYKTDVVAKRLDGWAANTFEKFVGNVVDLLRGERCVECGKVVHIPVQEIVAFPIAAADVRPTEVLNGMRR